MHNIKPVSCQPLLDRLTYIMSKTHSMNKFKALTTIREKIEFCIHADDLVYDGVNISISGEINHLLKAFYLDSLNNEKDDKLADKLKAQGTKAFLKRKEEEACKFYTKSLRYVSNITPKAALLYACRSAAHFYSKNYENCLEDIERAEKASYPSESKFKLLKRKTESLIQLGRSKKALETLSLAKECILPESKDDLQATLRQLENQIVSLNSNTEVDKDKENNTFEPVLFQQEKSNEISGALQIRFNEKEGRHIRAAMDIPKGSALFREKPFASILLPEYFLTHCQYCYTLLRNPVPCSSCCDVLWCDDLCKAEGERFHKFECRNLKILCSVGIAHLAARIALIAGWSTCQQVSKVQADISAVEEKIKEVFCSKSDQLRYEAVFSLVSHFSDAPAEDQFQYCLAGIILARVLMERCHFHHLETDEKFYNSPHERDEWDRNTEIELASLLVHHIAQLVSNSHAITQMQGRKSGSDNVVADYGQDRIATAIYPLASLMNHSCKASIINSFDSDILIIHSIRDISRGEQVYNCYGPHASRHEREERQSKLKQQYYFTCECDSCTDPQALLKEASWSGLKCPSCPQGIAVSASELSNPAGKNSINCFTCGEVLPVSEDLSLKYDHVSECYDNGKESLERGRIADAKNCFSKALHRGEELFTRNNEFLSCIRDSFAKCLASSGDYEESLKQLLISRKVIEERYGEDSVEVAYELLKYLDVAELGPGFDTRRLSEIDALRTRIEDIFSTHYGARSWRKYLNDDLFL